MKNELDLNKANNRLVIWFVAILLVLASIFYVISSKTTTQTVSAQTIAIDPIDLASIIKPWQITGKPLVYAKSVLLVDKDSGYPIYASNIDEKVPIASTTKIVTALVVLDHYKMDDIVTVSSKAINVPETKIHLRTNEKIKVIDLLQGMLINSGNDAAYALAEHYTGPEGNGFDAFIAQMNDKAKSLGMINSHFTDPAGLDDEALSSALDLAKAARVALDSKIITAIVTVTEKTVTDSAGLLGHPLKNSNRLIDQTEPFYMNEAIGLKTGFTLGAGHCLVSAITYNHKTLVGVVLNTNEFTNEASAKESYRLLQWGKQQVDANQ